MKLFIKNRFRYITHSCHFYVEKSLQLLQNHLVLTSVGLIGSDERLFLPVGPIDVSLTEGHSVWIIQVLEQNLPLLALKVRAFNYLLLGICPAQSVLPRIRGQAIWPLHILRDYCGPLLAVHVGSLDARLLTPIRPEHQTRAIVYCYASGLVEAIGNQHLAVSAVQLAHLDAVVTSVCPVELKKKNRLMVYTIVILLEFYFQSIKVYLSANAVND